MSLRIRSVERQFSNNSQVGASTALNQAASCVKSTSPIRRFRRARACGLRVAHMIGIVVAIFTLLSADCIMPDQPPGQPTNLTAVARLVNALPTCVTVNRGDPTAHIQVINRADRAFLVFVGGEAKAFVDNDTSECNLRIAGLPNTPTRLSTQFYEYTEANFGVTNQEGNNVIRPNDSINAYVGRPGLVLASAAQQSYRIQIENSNQGETLGTIAFTYSGNASVDIYSVNLNYVCPSDNPPPMSTSSVLSLSAASNRYEVSMPLTNHRFAFYHINDLNGNTVGCEESSIITLSSSDTHATVTIGAGGSRSQVYTLTVENNHTEQVVIFANDHRLEGEGLYFFENTAGARANVATVSAGREQMYRLRGRTYTFKAFLLTNILSGTDVSGMTPFARFERELTADTTWTITGP